MLPLYCDPYVTFHFADDHLIRRFHLEGVEARRRVTVLASLIESVAAAGVGVFAVSTFDTDYLFAKEAEFPAAVAALRVASHSVEGGLS
jgi:hypothetical protein